MIIREIERLERECFPSFHLLLSTNIIQILHLEGGVLEALETPAHERLVRTHPTLTQGDGGLTRLACPQNTAETSGLATLPPHTGQRPHALVEHGVGVREPRFGAGQYALRGEDGTERGHGLDGLVPRLGELERIADAASTDPSGRGQEVGGGVRGVGGEGFEEVVVEVELCEFGGGPHGRGDLGDPVTVGVHLLQLTEVEEAGGEGGNVVRADVQGGELGAAPAMALFSRERG